VFLYSTSENLLISFAVLTAGLFNGTIENLGDYFGN
jgi:hypothetical protein